MVANEGGARPSQERLEESVAGGCEEEEQPCGGGPGLILMCQQGLWVCGGGDCPACGVLFSFLWSPTYRLMMEHDHECWQHWLGWKQTPHSRGPLQGLFPWKWTVGCNWEGPGKRNGHLAPHATSTHRKSPVGRGGPSWVSPGHEKAMKKRKGHQR